MADRYWVGGTGTWSSANTANWSVSSGGAGGASVPTSADNVFFDANSNVGTGAFTVTMANTPRVCNDFTASGLDGTMTLAGTSIGLTVSGSLTFPATNFTRTYTGETTFNATTTGKTVTTNGVAFGGNVSFTGAGGAWTLGSAFSCGSSILTIQRGTFDTSSSGNYAVTAGSFNSNVSNTRTINLNASTLTFSSATGWVMTTSTNATLNAGTSTINFASTSPTFAGGGLTYYNVAFTSTALTTVSITGTNTFTNITNTARASIGITEISFSGNQTIGTLTLGNTGNGAYRTFLRSSTVGTTRTLSVTTFTATVDVDFRDISASGLSAPWSGSRFGNCLGNSGINFSAAKTVYWRATGSASWGATGSGSWSSSIGGTASTILFPLAQDTAIFPATTYPASGSTVTINANYNIGTIDTSLRTSNTMTLSISAFTPVVYGNWINGTAITQGSSINGSITFAGRTTQQITSAGTFSGAILVNSPSGSVTLQDNLTTSSVQGVLLAQGTLDLQSYTLSAGIFYSAYTTTRTLAFGTGQINCTGSNTTVYDTSTVTGLTVTGSKTVNITHSGGGSITVGANAQLIAQVQNLNFTGGTYALTTTTFAVGNVNFTGFAGTYTPSSGTSYIYGNLTLSTGMTLGASAGTIQFTSQGTQLITSNGRIFNNILLFFHSNSSYSSQLQDALTTSSAYYVQHSFGNIDLNNFTLSTGVFITNSGSTRSIAFGTGNITCTTTVNGNYLFTMETGYANFSYTGTPTVNLSSTATIDKTLSLGAPNNNNPNYQLNFNVTSGSYVLQAPYASSIGQNCYTGSVNFTGFSGTLLLAGNWFITRDLTYPLTMTQSYHSNSFYLYLQPPSGQTSNLQSNGASIQYPFYLGGITTGNIKLLSAISVIQITYFYSGKLDLNGKTFTGVFNIQNFAFEITFNGGTINTSGSVANNIGTNLTTVAGTGTGTISMTSASAKTFGGGGATFNCTLNQGGAGALTITGSSTYNNITNTYKSTGATSILFVAGTTNTFNNWNASGEATRLLTIGSTSAASHTLSKASGTVSANYLSISRSTATGGAFWYAGANSTDGGNNTGWIFSAAPSFESRFLLFF